MSWESHGALTIGELNPPAGKKRVAADEERVQALARKAYENRIDLARGGGVEYPDLQPHGARSRLHVLQCRFSKLGIGRIDEHAN